MAVTQVSGIYQMVLFLFFLADIRGFRKVKIVAVARVIHGAAARIGRGMNYHGRPARQIIRYSDRQRLQPLVVRSLVDAFKQRGAQIAFPGIRQHRQHYGPFLRFCHGFKGSRQRRP